MRATEILRRAGQTATLGVTGVAGLANVSHAAAATLAFPTEQQLLPLVVGGAFVLPALAALAYATLCRLGRRLGPVLGLCLLVVATVAVMGFLQPNLFVLRGS